jgi:hypothetical protein
MKCPVCGQENAAWRSKCEKCDAILKESKQEIASLTDIIIKEQGTLPTRGKLIGEGIGNIVTAVVVVAVFIGFLTFVRLMGVNLGEALGPLGMLIGPIGLVAAIVFPLIAVWKIGKGIVVANRKLTCLECGMKVNVLSTEKNFLCPHCAALLRPGSGKSADLVKITCPVCAAGWQSAPETDVLECHGCGTKLNITIGKARLLPADSHCPTCSKPIQKSAYACPACGSLLKMPHLENKTYLQSTQQLMSNLYKDPPLEKLPSGFTEAGVWQTSPKGNLIRAAWLGKTIADSLTPQANTNITTQVTFLYRLLKGISCLNLALDQDETQAATAQAIFQSYEPLLAAILQNTIDFSNGDFKIVTSFQNPLDYTTDKPESTEGRINQFLFTISSEQNLLAKRIATLLGQPCARLWPIPLYQYSSSGTYSSKSFKVSGWTKTKNENWVFQFEKLEKLPDPRAPVTL